MSAEIDKFQAELADQLSSFEQQLDGKVDEVRMLADIQQVIGRMLSEDGSNEARIRRILHDRFEAGQLRKETMQLVKSMLDGYISEQAPTSEPVPSPVPPPADTVPEAPQAAANDDALSSTVVLPSDTAVQSEGSAEARVQVGSVLRDRFLLQELITGGGMGVVYKAMDRRMAEAGDANPWVAIKVLSPQFAANGHALRALQQEATKGRCLTHPNIVRFIDFDRDDDLHFIVMEWLDGRTLADILDSADAGSIDKSRAMSIVRQIGHALDYAHRCGIVHADVKPGNIMIMPNGDAKLFDFGVARVRQKTLERQPDFDPGVLGLMTPAYSSMQVLTGESPTPADDVFSLACLLYRLLAGYRVFGPRNAAEAAEGGMEPQRLQNVTDEQWRVVRKALSYARITRFESMGDFVSALDFEEPGETDAVMITAPVREDYDELEPGSGAAKWLVAALLLVVAGGGAAWQAGVLDEYIDQFAPPVGITEITEPLDEPEVAAIERMPEAPSELPADQGVVAENLAGEVAANTAPVSEELPGPPSAGEALPEKEAEVLPIDELVAEPEVIEPEVIAEPLVDFSKLPPPTAELRLDGPVAEANVRLREDGSPVTIDLIRGATDFPLTLRLEEVSFSGNRSPWVASQYSFSDNGFVEFPVGQDRARVTLVMTPDPIREADQQSTVRVRDADSSESELGTINVVLEDDDQRRFESTLPVNTIGFATSQVSVREQDPAVQVDILRFNPDDTSMVVAYVIRDITATQGEDYFAPSGYTIEFGPGQRSARLLIPLVQDSEYEDNEAFSVELSNPESVAGSDVYFRTAVMIRDDD